MEERDYVDTLNKEGRIFHSLDALIVSLSEFKRTLLRGLKNPYTALKVC